MEHTNKKAIEILAGEYSDYHKNSWHYDRQYTMLVKMEEAVLPQADVIKSLPADSEIEHLIKQKFSIGLTGDDYELSANKGLIDRATVTDIKTCKWFRDWLAGNVL